MHFLLNDVQLTFWRAWRNFQDLPLNNRSMKIQWRRQLDVQAFKTALQDLVDKTDALRLRFTEKDGVPYQFAAQTCDPALEFRDFSDAAAPYSEAVDWLTSLEALPFDLKSKVFSTALAKVADDHWIWLLNQHHVITDFTSSALLIERLSYLYRCRLKGAEPTGGPYPSFLTFQRRHLQSQSQISFEGARPPRLHPALTIEPDRLPKPKRYIRREFHLGQTRLARFRSNRELPSDSQGKRFNAALYETVLATTFAFIHRISGETHIAIGTMSHGRFTPASQGIVGPLIRNLPLSIDIEDAWSCADLLSAVQTHRRDIFRAARQGTAIRGEPVGAIINYIPDTMPNFDGVRSQEIAKWQPAEAISCDLNITVRAADTPGDVKVLFNLNQDVTELLNADVMTEIFLRILDAFIDSPACKIDEIPLIGPEDVLKEKSRAQAAMATVPLSYDSLTEGFLQQVERDPEAIAIIDGDRRLTFRDLEQRSRWVASALLARGLGPDRVIGLRLPRSAQLIITVLGILRAAGTFLALDSRQPAKRVSYFLNDSNAQLLVLPKGEDASALDIRIPVIDPERLMQEGRFHHVDLPTLKPDGTMYVMYTSGTSGEPKGVQVPHQSFARYQHWACNTIAPGQPITWAMATTISFESAFRAFMPLTTGGAVVTYQAPFALTDMSIVHALRDDQVDGIAITPSQLRQLCNEEWSPRRLRSLIVMGETLTTELAQRAQKAFGPKVTLYNFYGPTESTMATSAHVFNSETDADSTVPVGVAGDGAALHILDAYGNPLPDGLIGEICVGGTRLSKGYLNNPELTAQKFLPDPFRAGGVIYRTGDLGRYNKQAEIVHHGRSDDQIKINGVRIELAEVEFAVTHHPDVINCAVVAIDQPARQLVAFYVANRDIPSSRLRKAAEQVLTRGAVPRVFVRIDAIPILTNGKTDRLSLIAQVPDQPMEEADSSSENSAPQGPTEVALSHIWRRILNLETIPRQSDFFDLGGDSLSFVQMILTTEKEFDVSLPVEKFGDSVTLEELASVIGGLKPAISPSENKAQQIVQQEPLLATARTPWPAVRRLLLLAANTWDGITVGRELPILQFNGAGANPPLFWCFNSALEPPVMARELGPEQLLYALRSMQAVVERGQKKGFYTNPPNH